MAWGTQLVVLGLSLTFASGEVAGARKCGLGFDSNCNDLNECEETSELCGTHSKCTNTLGSYYCECLPGFNNLRGPKNFTSVDGQCIDDNECLQKPDICGPRTECKNQIGNYSCVCLSGYIDQSGECIDEDECIQGKQEEICGPEGICANTEGSFWCNCSQGYTNYGNERMPCSQLDCGVFSEQNTMEQKGLANILSLMRNSCLSLSDSSKPSAGKLEGDSLLEKLFTETSAILSSGGLDEGDGVSRFLDTVESSIRLIGPQLRENRTRIGTADADAEIAVHRGSSPPAGPVRLADENALLETDWSTAAGTGPYRGFALAGLLTYKNLSLGDSFDEIQGYERNGVEPSFQVLSHVVSVVVSNPSTQSLSNRVRITLKHQQDLSTFSNVSFICAYWGENEAWSPRGCFQVRSNLTHTLCSCDHLSSFAVLMALYPVEDTFALVLITKVGLTLSLICLLICILTFHFCRSIQGTRTTIHLHLCVCLFVADLFFLVGISQTQPVGGCRFVAAMLHLFFLGVFSWMLLEGVQLYRMVVLVFNPAIRPLYLFAVGYGAPLAIVVISAVIRPEDYGTSRHCWLSLENGLIWSFFGPVCTIIFLNVFFFIVTVWKLAQKFASLNPDLSKLNTIKAFTVTAIAQMCILGLMWVFGAFLFRKENVAAAYIFTSLNSMQGILVFVMHCLLSKQVRDEYAHFLSCICTPQKKRYSDFSSTNPSSSQTQGSRSGQHTGESRI